LPGCNRDIGVAGTGPTPGLVRSHSPPLDGCVRLRAAPSHLAKIALQTSASVTVDAAGRRRFVPTVELSEGGTSSSRPRRLRHRLGCGADWRFTPGGATQWQLHGVGTGGRKTQGQEVLSVSAHRRRRRERERRGRRVPVQREPAVRLEHYAAPANAIRMPNASLEPPVIRKRGRFTWGGLLRTCHHAMGSGSFLPAFRILHFRFVRLWRAQARLSFSTVPPDEH
jgi:hypothetical protein